MLSGMFSVSDTEAAAIRAAYERGGELAAAVELRRYFAGIDSTAQARDVHQRTLLILTRPIRASRFAAAGPRPSRA